jgi:hypothetical protein
VVVTGDIQHGQLQVTAGIAYQYSIHSLKRQIMVRKLGVLLIGGVALALAACSEEAVKRRR